MVRIIESSPVTKKLVGNMFTELRKIKPEAKYIDYSLFQKTKHRRISLISDESSGVLRNVSLVNLVSKNPFVKTARLAIWNESGAVRIHEHSIFTSVETLMKRLNAFLGDVNNESNALFAGHPMFPGKLKGYSTELGEKNSTLTVKVTGYDIDGTHETVKPYMSEKEFLKPPSKDNH